LLDYKCILPLTELHALEDDPERTHHLFTARGEKGDSVFFVQKSPECPPSIGGRIGGGANTSRSSR
jgi:hypothetical protein